MAFNSLLAGQSSLAVNSGVNLTLTPDTFAMFQAGGVGQGMLSQNDAPLASAHARP